jgi:hypothetical protein
MPAFESVAAGLLIGAAGAAMAAKASGLYARWQERGFARTIAEVDRAMRRRGGEPEGDLEGDDALDGERRYVFGASGFAASARAELRVLNIDGSRYEIDLTLTRPESASLPGELALTLTNRARFVREARARLDLPRGVTLEGEALGLVSVIMPSLYDKLIWFDLLENIDLARFEISEGAVRLAASCGYHDHRATSPPFTEGVFNLSIASAVDHMIAICEDVRWEDPPLLGVLRAGVLEGEPGSALRSGALRTMIERAPRARSTRAAWGHVVERGHHKDLLLCHEIAPARLERDLPDPSIFALAHTLGDRPHEEQEAFAALIVRRLGLRAFESNQITPRVMLVLFTCAYDDALLDREDLANAFTSVAAVAAFHGTLDALCEVVGARGWGAGAHVIAKAVVNLGARANPAPLVDMLSRVAQADPAAAREYEVETALIGLLEQSAPEHVRGEVTSTLAIVGGQRAVESLRKAARGRFLSDARRASYEDAALAIEDRLAGIVNRGALTVTDDGSTVGGLTQARAAGGALEMSEEE